ncbi:MAG TPA: DUF6036 family nucleotidyltransferase [Thermoanaerobaculia bacterium]|nr:DUF6036 family nucleotidyltransferase [Thermoanaerobaculia bacterium]
MDDEADRGYSRAPELEDLLTVCRALNREGARYILIGGFAVILHGLVRTTKDIDLLVDASEENVRRVKRALADLPDNAAALVEDGDVRKYGVVRVADEVVVDLLASACSLGYEDAVLLGVDRRQIEDVDLPLASKPLLIRLKETVRESDASDVRFLRLRIEEERGR